VPLVFVPPWAYSLAMRICGTCGTDNPDIARFCLACGSSLAEREPGAVEERRIVTVVFVDLVGFTSRAEQLDPEDVRDFLTPYFERVRAEIEGFGGSVEKFIGDAVLGVFGAPTAYGDDPERAVRAALAVRDWAADEQLQVRIAVNTGEAIVSLAARVEHGESMVAGDVINTASRLQTAAPVGSVLAGGETYAATRTAIQYAPAEPVVAKGKALPVQAWVALDWLQEGGERVLTRVPMVGRDRELAALIEEWDRVTETRRPHFVTVFGPAGIGKSRLTLEFAEHVGNSGGRVLRGRAIPYGASGPYSAFAQQVKQVASVFDSDELGDAQAKLVSAVAAFVGDEEAAEHARHLAMLVGMGGNGGVPDRETLFFSARVLIEALASREPTLLVFEDIHWADDSLLDLLETLAGRVRDVPVLLLALARPELLGQRPAWGGGLPAYSALPLEALSEDAANDLAQHLLAPAGDGPDRAAMVAETAEGNPLFIEELAASLAEKPAAEASSLPTSIRAIIAGRLDALPPAERAVVLDAAVVGRIFWRGALASMSKRDDLGTILASLEQRDFVRREPVSRIQGDQQYTFKHALIRDVAYGILPRAARRERHAVVARFLEETTGGAGQSHDAIGVHWREAGENERAVQSLLAAAEQAGRGWAKERAIALYRDALELLPEDATEQRREIRRREAIAMTSLYHVADARLIQRARQRQDR
jgi:class 3 adenylate cyclase